MAKEKFEKDQIIIPEKEVEIEIQEEKFELGHALEEEEKKSKELAERFKRSILKKKSKKDEDKDEQVIKSETRKQVEIILQNDLKDIFQLMNDSEKEAFKQEGIKVSTKIEEMIETLKIKARVVLNLVKNWLSMIPSVNKYFLEQESKLKTDEIMAYAKKRKRQIKLKNKNKI